MKKIFSLFTVFTFVFSLTFSQENEQTFLAANKTKKGIITTASGLQYEIITKGNGQKPTLSNQVRVHYIGTLTDGTEFDNSYKRGATPTVFPVNAVISGWQEGLQLMPIGSKYKFYIPSALAYGTSGAGRIKPNSTLIFVVELIGIVGVNDSKPIDVKPAQTETKPIAAKPATAAIDETTASNSSLPKSFEEQLNAIIFDPNNNFKNVIGAEINIADKNFYATDYAANIVFEGFDKAKITKYPTEKKLVFNASSVPNLDKASASKMVDDILKKIKKAKLPYTYFETVQYNVATRRLITFNFKNSNNQLIGIDMDIDALSNGDGSGSDWQVTIRITKKITSLNIFGN